MDFDKYLPILDRIISDQSLNKTLIGLSEDALNDIWIFCDKKKIKELRNVTCVSRYFNILAISHNSEKEQQYAEGIKKIKDLRERETNPSIRNIQQTSITYLSHFV